MVKEKRDGSMKRMINCRMAHVGVLAADIKGDKVMDITRHCVFKNPMPR